MRRGTYTKQPFFRDPSATRIRGTFAAERQMTTQFRLGDGVPRDAVEDVCEGLGLRLSNVVPRSTSHPAQAIFVSPDRQTLLHVIDDDAAGRAIIVRGPRAEELSSELLRALGTAGAAEESA